MATAVAHDEARMSLMEHLRELRDRIIKVAIAIAVGMVISFLLYNQLFHWLLGPYRAVANDHNTLSGDKAKLLLTDPLGGFGIRMRMAAYGGIFIAMPVILWQLWRFITPGLYSHEKRYAVPFLLSSIVLFLLGAGIAFTTLPKALEFLIDIGGDQNFVTAFAPDKYFKLITYMMLAFGIGFEFPILLIFLKMAGIIQVDQLRQWRRYAIVGICILVAVITPSGDPFSMLALSVPMCAFYEIAIWVGWAMDRKQRKAEKAAAAAAS
jgi:sec-independent protein translocase protein TatC